jgi:hypothetical protein
MEPLDDLLARQARLSHEGADLIARSLDRLLMFWLPGPDGTKWRIVLRLREAFDFPLDWFRGFVVTAWAQGPAAAPEPTAIVFAVRRVETTDDRLYYLTLVPASDGHRETSNQVIVGDTVPENVARVDLVAREMWLSYAYDDRSGLFVLAGDPARATVH